MSTRGWAERAIDLKTVRSEAFTASFESQALFDFGWSLDVAFPTFSSETVRKVGADVILEFCDRGWFTLVRSPELSGPPRFPIPRSEWESVLRDPVNWEAPESRGDVRRYPPVYFDQTPKAKREKDLIEEWIGPPPPRP